MHKKYAKFWGEKSAKSTKIQKLPQYVQKEEMVWNYADNISSNFFLK